MIDKLWVKNFARDKGCYRLAKRGKINYVQNASLNKFQYSQISPKLRKTPKNSLREMGNVGVVLPRCDGFD